jgi:hypothetical protein
MENVGFNINIIMKRNNLLVVFDDNESLFNADSCIGINICCFPPIPA